MSKKDFITLVKILGYAKSTIEFCNDIQTEAEFENDCKTNMACAFALTQIGELSSDGLSNEAKESIVQIPWAKIKGLRNRIVHGYDIINMAVIWDTIKNDMPVLVTQIEEVINNYL